MFFISSPSPPQPENTEWTYEENKLFENAIAEFNITSPDLSEQIGLIIPGKTFNQIKEHYEALVEDIENIETGNVPLPDYKNDDKNYDDEINRSTMAMQNRSSYQPGKRRKWVPWTKEEHENFVTGLQMFGKGDWKSISRYCVKTKNPTQVATHAQKYFLRLEKANSTSEPNKP